MRRVQRLAYRMRQLQVTHSQFGRTAQQTWQDDPIWQPLREVIETLLVTWDWGEALVALQFVLKPALDELFMTQFGRLARAGGDDVLDRMFFSLNEDCAWHRAWSGSLLLTAIRDTPASIPAVERWIETWVPRVSRAIAAFHPIFDEMCQAAKCASQQCSARSSNSGNATANPFSAVATSCPKSRGDGPCVPFIP